MCGIIAAFNTEGKAVNDFIINQYENQYSRGEEGFGIIRINEKGKVHLDRACEPTKFMMDLYTKKSKMIIAHHRFPTSTDNLIDQTHPMSISNPILDYDYLVIHNGVVRNDDELREKHIKLGFEYQTEYREVYGYSVNPTYTTKFNDSEAIAIELALFIEGKSAAIETEGSAALIALQIDKETKTATKVFFCRNVGGVLNIHKSKGKIRLSSEGVGEEIKANELCSFKIKDKEMELDVVAIPFVMPKVVEVKKDIPVVEQAIEVAKEKKAEKEAIQNNLESREGVQRSWSKEYISDANLDSLPPYASKGYIETTCAEFKERIKEDSSMEITHTLDDALDEELEKVTELVTDYKNTLLTERLSNDDLSFYSSQIFRITKTMKQITDIADEDYKEKLLLEEQEVADYNAGWPDVPEAKKDVEREAMMKAYENDMMGYRDY